MDAATWLRQREYHTFSDRSFTHGPLCALGALPFRSQTLLKAHSGCVNALALSDGGGDFLASGGDDLSVVLWNMSSAISTEAPVKVVDVGHTQNIFSLCFTNQNRTLVSAGCDARVIAMDVETGNARSFELHNEPVHKVANHAMDPQVIYSASEDQTICQLDLRTNSGRVLLRSAFEYTSVVVHPHMPHLLIAGFRTFPFDSMKEVQVFDIRRPTTTMAADRQIAWPPVFSYELDGACPSPHNRHGVTGLAVNTAGTQMVVTLPYRRPVLVSLDMQRTTPLAVFDARSYHHQITMKNSCFAGFQDEYVVAGSDDCSICVWEIPKEIRDTPGPPICVSDSSSSASSLVGRKIDTTESDTIHEVHEPHQVLYGHRSIPNQVLFHPKLGLLLSSGVEKSIRMWSRRPLSMYSFNVLDSRPRRQDDQGRPVRSFVEDDMTLWIFSREARRVVEWFRSDSEDSEEFEGSDDSETQAQQSQQTRNVWLADSGATESDDDTDDNDEESEAVPVHQGDTNGDGTTSS